MSNRHYSASGGPESLRHWSNRATSYRVWEYIGVGSLQISLQHEHRFWGPRAFCSTCTGGSTPLRESYHPFPGPSWVKRVLQYDDLPQNRPRTSAPSLIHFKVPQYKNIIFTFIWPCCIVTNFVLMKPKDALVFPSLFLSRNSTCFGQSLCPSSGVFHCTFGTGICHASLMTYTSAECTVQNSRW